MRKLDNKGSWGIAVLIAIILILLAVIGVVVNSAYNVRYDITGTVINKWIDIGSEGSHYLLKIKLESGKVKMLEVNRNILHGSDFNPDLVFSDINLNVTYKFTCWGWDWQWADIYMYPMVIIAEELN